MKTLFTSTNYLNAINNWLSLAQIFIVILFFENYLILFEDSSLLKISVNFDNIKIAPLIGFFIFIASGKVIWVFVRFALLPLRDNYSLSEDFSLKLDAKTHFTIFLLFVLSLCYSHVATSDEGFFTPIITMEITIYEKLRIMLASMTSCMTLLIMLVADIKEEWAE